jgi:NADH-quinone oxidoreductase subunit C
VADEVRDVVAQDWVETARAARDDGYAFFDLLTGVDLEEQGIEVVCRLWDVGARRGLLLRCRVPRDAPVVPTLTPVYGGAAWHERATAELLGVEFAGHDTQHLLLPEGFDRHPLRKDFALASRAAKPWPGAKEPGESDADLRTPRRRPSPPGRPAGWER